MQIERSKCSNSEKIAFRRRFFYTGPQNHSYLQDMKVIVFKETQKIRTKPGM